MDSLFWCSLHWGQHVPLSRVAQTCYPDVVPWSIHRPLWSDRSSALLDPPGAIFIANSSRCFRCTEIVLAHDPWCLHKRRMGMAKGRVVVSGVKMGAVSGALSIHRSWGNTWFIRWKESTSSKGTDAGCLLDEACSMMGVDSNKQIQSWTRSISVWRRPRSMNVFGWRYHSEVREKETSL